MMFKKGRLMLRFPSRCQIHVMPYNTAKATLFPAHLVPLLVVYLWYLWLLVVLHYIYIYIYI